MEHRKSTHEEIEKTLQSIDSIGRADMPAFFYTRLQAKIDNTSSSNNFWIVITKPSVSLVTLSLLVVLNIAAITYFIKTPKRSNQLHESSGIQTFAQEYDLTVSSVYNDKTTR